MATLAEPAAAEQPILWLGLTGFSPEQRAMLEASLLRPGNLPRWRACAFGDADAWWVNGARVRVMPDGNLKVAAGLPTEHALNLNLADVDRPIAFATPLASTDFEPACKFDPSSEPAIQAVLMQFERWLWLVRAQFVLGAQIIRSGAALRQGIYHVVQAGKLLAVLDFQNGKAALLPGVHPANLWEARWDKRPGGAGGAGGLPQSFFHCTPGQLAWVYVGRTDQDVLPERYRTQTIYYRQAPAVPLRWLRDSQMLLLRELSTEPGTLEALRQRTGLAARQMEHDLACLYYAGSITTTSAKAAVPAHAQPDSQPSCGPEMDSRIGHGATSGTQFGITAPVQLEQTRGAAGDGPARRGLRY